MANPDPAIHTQSRFGGLLGRDGTFVSHVEAGRRMIPLSSATNGFSSSDSTPTGYRIT
jgi:hypothetical protein